ncbi:Ion transport protein-domain-containing protein [Pelagophyceae sp. CCMP2097]|nr:Ion transport protein-domain-containing protein [Pelagophyceae sp. CCMP2097]
MYDGGMKIHPDGVDGDEPAVATVAVCENSLGFFHKSNPYRIKLLAFVTSKRFDMAILFFIGLNSVCMLATDYRDGCLGRSKFNGSIKKANFGLPDPTRCGFNGFAELVDRYVLFTVFLAECLVKIVAMGFICEGRGTYLRDAWNVLDFVCVIAMLMAEFDLSGGLDLKVLRMFRLLRPLKSVNKFPSLKKLVGTFLLALPRLGNVVALMTILLLIWSIAGMQFFKGALHQRCRITKVPTRVPVTWYRPCLKADFGDGRFLDGGANCIRGIFFPTNDEFDAYKEAMVQWTALGDDDWTAYATSAAFLNASAVYGWEPESATHSEWACRNGAFQAPKYPLGIPVTDTYPHRYPKPYNARKMGAHQETFHKVWRSRQRCIWLVDEEDTRPCTLGDQGGLHVCYGAARQQRGRGGDASDYAHPRRPALDVGADGYLPLDIERGPTTCGSNFDADGHARFKFMPPLYTKQLLRKHVPKKLDDWGRFPSGLFASLYPEFIEDLNFGYTNFDNLGYAFVSLFQAVTMEGWTDIMYQCMNVATPFWALTLFVSLFACGSMLVLNLVLGVIADTLSDEEQAEEEQEQEEHLAAIAAGLPAPEPHPKHASMDDSDDAAAVARLPPWRRALYDVVASQGFSYFIYACIFLNTFALFADDYPRPASWTHAMSMINFALSLVFIAEMVLKVAAMGPRMYTADSFNCFDGTIVIIGIISMVLALLEFNFGGGAVSALRCARVFRIFKLAKNWKSLQVLLRTMVETAQQIGPFLVLLILFTFIFTLAGMSFFANELRFDDETGAKIRFSTRSRETDLGAASVRAGMTKFSWETMSPRRQSRRKVSTAFKVSAPPDLNFDDFGAASVTVFGILTGESWNLVMYDMMRGRNSLGWGVAYIFVTVVILAFFVMNMFLAILLSGFEGNEELAAPAPTRGISFRSAAKAVKVFSALERNSLRRGPAVHPDGATPDATSLSKAFAARASAAGAFAASAVAAAAAAARAPSSPSPPIADAVAEAAPASPEAASTAADELLDPFEDAYIVRPSLAPYDRSLGIFPARSPIRLRCTAVTMDWRFDSLIVACILVGSAMMAASSPLMNPRSNANRALDAVGFFFNAVYYVECIVKVVSMGFAVNGPTSYLRDVWNILDFIIVIVSTVDMMEIEGVAAIKVLRVFRVFRPLRMLSRNPGLKLVLNCLVVAIPNAINVMLVCVIIILIFAIMGVGFFKGQMDACNFDVALPSSFDSEYMTEERLADVQRLITYPIHLKKALRTGHYDMLYNATRGDPRCWVGFGEEFINKKTYFNAKTNVVSREAQRYERLRPTVLSSNYVNYLTRQLESGVAQSTVDFFASRYADVEAVTADVGQAAGHLLRAGGNVDMYIPTSKDMCQCVYYDSQSTTWANPLYMSFDDVPRAFMLLFEIYSTEGWLDYMFHNVDARGIEMQPVRDHNYRPSRTVPRFYSYGFHIAFQFIGGFFAMQLFVGVIIEQFSKLKEEAEKAGRSSALMTESQEQWAKTEKFLMKVRPRRRIKPVIPAFHAVVEGRGKAAFENGIMLCILLNGAIMCLEYFGQPAALTTAIALLNGGFAVVFTLEAVLKIGGVGWHLYIGEAWNKFDFVIVAGTIVGYIVGLASSASFGPLASVIRLFRIARVTRLFNSAKNLKKQVSALMSAVPQMFNVLLVLMIFISIFAILLVELYAHVAFSGAVHANANFKEFGTAVLTLLRFTTGENWNGFMHDMNYKWRAKSGCWKLFSRFDKVRRDMYRGDQAEEQWNTKWCTRQDGNDRRVCPCKKFTRHGQVKDMCQVYASYDDCCVPLSGCGDKWVAGVVIHIFDLLVTGVVLNLFVGIILDAYDQDDEEDDDSLTEKHLQAFVEDWSRFDEEATWFIRLEQFKEFIQILDEPMGFGEQYVASNEELELKILRLGVKIQARHIDAADIGASKLHIRDVAVALGRRVVAEKEGTADISRPDERQRGNMLVEASPMLERLFGRSYDEVELCVTESHTRARRASHPEVTASEATARAAARLVPLQRAASMWRTTSVVPADEPSSDGDAKHSPGAAQAGAAPPGAAPSPRAALAAHAAPMLVAPRRAEAKDAQDADAQDA